jgi:hypothetical protein
VFAGVVALDERKLRVVGSPLDGFRWASGDAAAGEDGLDGESFLGCGGGRLGAREGN